MVLAQCWLLFPNHICWWLSVQSNTVFKWFVRSWTLFYATNILYRTISVSGRLNYRYIVYEVPYWNSALLTSTTFIQLHLQIALLLTCRKDLDDRTISLREGWTIKHLHYRTISLREVWTIKHVHDHTISLREVWTIKHLNDRTISLGEVWTINTWMTAPFH